MKTFARVSLGLVLIALGLYVTGADDKPGIPIGGAMLMTAGIVLGVRAMGDRISRGARRTTIVVGIIAAATAAYLIHDVVVTGPLFATEHAVPSAADPAAPPQYSAAVERARDLARAAVVEQNLPGVSVAVGAGGALVWAEGFGTRDIVTRAPMTPATRFNIGTAATAVVPFVSSLGLTNTGTDAAAAWSPEHIGEPEEDFPLFANFRHVFLRPLGIVPAKPLADNRATFYVPRSGDDPRRGRWMMYMRDLACCANGMSFYSTPSDLVRFALATRPGDINGTLAGGTVMSLVTRPDNGVVVVVASNMAHAKTAALAIHIGELLTR